MLAMLYVHFDLSLFHVRTDVESSACAPHPELGWCILVESVKVCSKHHEATASDVSIKYIVQPHCVVLRHLGWSSG
jgi:hypothetical protein